MSTVRYAWGKIHHGQPLTWRTNMGLSPVFDVKMVPKTKSSIVYINVRVDDPVNIDDSDKLLDLVEAKFPDFNAEHIVGGYKQYDPTVVSVDPKSTDK